VRLVGCGEAAKVPGLSTQSLINRFRDSIAPGTSERKDVGKQRLDVTGESLFCGRGLDRRIGENGREVAHVAAPCSDHRAQERQGESLRESSGWVPWTEEDTAKYRAPWPLGTEARLR
jgi:hypothetical protein